MRLQKIVSNLKPAITTIGEYRLVAVSHIGTLDRLDHDVDGLVVDRDEVVQAVLQHDHLYLKPMFYQGKTHRQCDGEVTSATDPRIASRLDILLPQIDTYQGLSLPDAPDRRLLTKLVRYLSSRNTRLEAMRSRVANIGYAFPLVEDMSIERDSLRIIKHLGEFASQGYLHAEPIDKINICYDCQGSYLNFSECCTKCNSLDLSTEELIHHFRCAYVGPQSDFVKDEKLICPKCDHQLKHIGIDYDKPSEIHTCKSCNHSSQETKMKARCVDCGKENELEQLVTHTINNYQITEKAKSYSRECHTTAAFDETVTSSNSSLTSMAAYTLIMSHEGRKATSNEVNTYDMVTTIEVSLLAQLNKGMQTALLEEVATIIKPYLPVNHLMAIDANQHIRTLLIDYSLQDANNLQDVLDYNLNKMLRDNGWSDDNVVHVTVQPIQL